MHTIKWESVREISEKQHLKKQYDHFEYQVMLFGLTNASASFQKYINKILAEKFNIFVIVYLENIFIYIDNNKNGHILAVWWVFK